jgi:hypothetical protein
MSAPSTPNRPITTSTPGAPARRGIGRRNNNSNSNSNNNIPPAFIPPTIVPVPFVLNNNNMNENENENNNNETIIGEAEEIINYSNTPLAGTKRGRPSFRKAKKGGKRKTRKHLKSHKKSHKKSKKSMKRK